MKMASAKGMIVLDDAKFRYLVVYETWNSFKNEWVTAVYKRTNDEKAAIKAIKKFEEKHSEYSRNATLIDSKS